MRIILFLMTLVLIQVYFSSQKKLISESFFLGRPRSNSALRIRGNHRRSASCPQTLNELCIQTYIEKSKNSILTIAVVGNGPISDTDIKFIKEFDFDLVLQFNHAMHYDAIGRCDILAIRPLEGGHDTSKLSHSKKMIQKLNSKNHILPVVLTKDRVTLFESLNVNQCNILSPIFIHEEYFKNRVPKSHSLAEHTLFNCKEERCKYKNTSYGPSTGAAVLNELYHLGIIKKIDIFGMNSFGGPHHVDFKYPTIIKDYCNKCFFHKTPTDSYR